MEALNRREGLSTKTIAVAGIAAACAAFILTLGYYLSFGEFFWYFCASLPISAPKSAQIRFFTYLSSCALAAILCGGNMIYLAAYIFLFGPFPVVLARVARLRFALRHAALALFAFSGLLMIFMLTPMFVYQLSTTSDRTAAIIIVLSLIAASVPLEIGYVRLYRAVCGYLTGRGVLPA